MVWIVIWGPKEYFVYFKVTKAPAAPKDPLRSDKTVWKPCQNKKGAGRMFSPRTDSRFASSCHFVFTHVSALKQTEPCGPWHGGGREPYGRWKWPFSCGNREPWICGDGWADRYASYLHLLSLYNTMLNSQITDRSKT